MEQDDRFFEQQNLIRRFLNGNLLGEELDEFKARLIYDEELKSELEFTTAIQGYFKQKEQKRLKSEFVKLKENSTSSISNFNSNAISNDEPEILLSVLNDLECIPDLKEKIRRRVLISVEMMENKKIKFRQVNPETFLKCPKDETLCLGPLKFYFNDSIDENTILDIFSYEGDVLLSKVIPKGVSKDCINFNKVLTEKEEILSTGYYYFILTIGDQDTITQSFYYIRPDEVTELFLEDVEE